MNTVREMLEQNRVLDLGPLPAPRLAANATVHQALQFLVRGRRGAIVVLDDEKPVGIFTERDVVYRLPTGLFASREERKQTPLRDVMSAPPATIERRARLVDAITLMDRQQHRHLVVVDEQGGLKGLLTTSDLVQFLTDQFPEDTVNLPPRLRQVYRSTEGA